MPKALAFAQRRRRVRLLRHHLTVFVEADRSQVFRSPGSIDTSPISVTNSKPPPSPLDRIAAPGSRSCTRKRPSASLPTDGRLRARSPGRKHVGADRHPGDRRAVFMNQPAHSVAPVQATVNSPALSWSLRSSRPGRDRASCDGTGAFVTRRRRNCSPSGRIPWLPRRDRRRTGRSLTRPSAARRPALRRGCAHSRGQSRKSSVTSVASAAGRSPASRIGNLRLGGIGLKYVARWSPSASRGGVNFVVSQPREIALPSSWTPRRRRARKADQPVGAVGLVRYRI